MLLRYKVQPLVVFHAKIGPLRILQKARIEMSRMHVCSVPEKQRSNMMRVLPHHLHRIYRKLCGE